MKKQLILTGTGRTFKADTATDLILQIRNLHWQAGDDTSPEDYIAIQDDAYKRMTGRHLQLPETDTEERARAMFRQIAQAGGWDYKEEE